MRALITGAGGFCGKHLLTYLRQQDVEVYTLGKQAVSENHFYTEMTDVSGLAEMIKCSRPDYIFHLAGIAHSTDLSLFYKINTAYAATLLQALELAGRIDTPLLMVGTSAEYGRVTAEELPITEQTAARPYHHYGISKLAQTLMGVASARSGRPVIVVRPFNIIGEGMPEHLMMKSFARQITDIALGRRAPVIEVGNLNTSRDFIEVGDVVKIYWRLVQTPAAYGEIVNVCSGRETCIGDVLNKMLEISGVQAQVRTDAARLRPDEVVFHYGSVEKLKSLTGVATQENLDSILKRILSVEMHTHQESD